MSPPRISLAALARWAILEAGHPGASGAPGTLRCPLTDLATARATCGGSQSLGLWLGRIVADTVHPVLLGLSVTDAQVHRAHTDTLIVTRPPKGRTGKRRQQLRFAVVAITPPEYNRLAWELPPADSTGASTLTRADGETLAFLLDLPLAVEDRLDLALTSASLFTAAALIGAVRPRPSADVGAAPPHQETPADGASSA